MSTLSRLSCLVLLGAALGCGHTPTPAPDAGPADAGSDGGEGTDGGSGDGGGASDGGDGGAFPVKVLALYPGEGPAAGGTQVLLSGAGFVEGFATRGGGLVSKVTQVRIGGVLAQNVDVIDDNRINLLTPATAPGPADVTVQNPNGTGTCAGCFRSLARVEVSAVEPARGPTQGGIPLTVRGLGFVEGALVTVGGRTLIGLAIVDGQTARGLLPPGPSGGADVSVTTRDGRGEARRGFVYQDALALTGVEPQTVSTAGGASVTVRGQGFSAQAGVLLDGVAAPTRWVDEQTLVVSAPAHAEGAVAVAVSDPGALDVALVTRARGLVYVAPSPVLPRALRLDAVAPRQGPLAGGACPAACVRLLGTGLSTPDLQVSIGASPVSPAALHPQDDGALDLDLPASAQPGPVAVSLSSVARAETAVLAASDPGAFRYLPPLEVTDVTPARAPASGAPGTVLTVSGAGFSQSPGAPLAVRLGALPLTGVTVAADGRSLTGTAPAGPSGPADLEVSATDADGFSRTATLAAAVWLTAPLQVLRVSPARGAQAGGTRVALEGDGFAPGVTALLGGRPLTDVVLRSATRLEGLTLAASPGPVAATVQLASAQATLAAGFTYFDPASGAGGVGGGPLLGVLNVSVLEASLYKDGGVQAADVIVRFQSGAQLTGKTDARGQVTFSDARLVLPVRVTASKALYQAITLDAVQAENVSVYLAGPAGPPPPPPDPPPPPPPPAQTARVGGHVFGFKPPPGLALAANQRLVAWVQTTRGSIYSAPPFYSQVRPIVVTADGGPWSFETTRLSPTTVYALYGIETTRGPNLFDLEPLLLGVRRDLEPDPAQALTDADILLDTHLDQGVTATFAALPEEGTSLRHDAAVTLDLGASGLIPLSSVSSTAQSLSFTHLPKASGQGFVFVDIVSGQTAESVYLRRIFGDVSGGIVLGPYLPFPRVQAPTSPQGPFGGVFSWTLAPALSPNLVQVSVAFPKNGDVAGLSWSAVLPPGSTSVQLPEELLPRLSPGVGQWNVEVSLAPGFDYTYWSYNDLYGGSWTTWAYDVGSFVVAP